MLNRLRSLSVCFICCLLSLQSIAATGPSNADIKQTITAVYAKYKNTHQGKNADYIPVLAEVNPKLFGIVVITASGDVISVGDTETPFAIESISKPFAYILALQDNGEKLITDKVGLNATGRGFNSIPALQDAPEHLQNPLVNAGAIQTTSFIKGDDSNDKWNRMLSFVKKLSDGKPYLGTVVYQSETATNSTNQKITQLLDAYHMLNSDPQDALDRYTKACSIMVTARELALMGATLANDGEQPLTHKQLINPKYVRDALSQMVVNGLYDDSGAWFWSVGLPAKSGVGGAILAVVPHKMAIVVFSPPLDGSGNSVKAQLVIKELSQRWHLHLLN